MAFRRARSVLPSICQQAARFFRNRVEEDLYTRMRPIIVLNHVEPHLGSETFLAPNAQLVGAVSLSPKSSVWYGAVLRGDLNEVVIGSTSNVQDRSIIHAARSTATGLQAAAVIGDNVTIGPGSILRSVLIEDGVDIGQRCVLAEGSMVEEGAALAPKSVLPPARRVPAGELWGGNPAQFIRKLEEEEQIEMEANADRVAVNALRHDFEFPEHGLQYVDAEKIREKAQRIRSGRD